MADRVLIGRHLRRCPPLDVFLRSAHDFLERAIGAQVAALGVLVEDGRGDRVDDLLLEVQPLLHGAVALHSPDCGADCRRRRAQKLHLLMGPFSGGVFGGEGQHPMPLLTNV